VPLESLNKMIDLANKETITQAIDNMLAAYQDHLFFPIGNRVTALVAANNSHIAEIYRKKYPFPLHVDITYDDNKYVVFYSVPKPD